MHYSEIFRNMWNVWRTVLEENEKLARARLAAVEVFHQQIADDAKVLKAHKVQTARKVEHFPLLVQSCYFCVWSPSFRCNVKWRTFRKVRRNTLWSNCILQLLFSKIRNKNPWHVTAVVSPHHHTPVTCIRLRSKTAWNICQQQCVQYCAQML
jgi:hypothetical protein